MPSHPGLMVSSKLSPPPRAEKVRLCRGCGPRAWGRAQPQVKEGQLTATSCSQYPAVSNISFYPVITQTSLFSFQVSKFLVTQNSGKHYHMGIPTRRFSQDLTSFWQQHMWDKPKHAWSKTREFRESRRGRAAFIIRSLYRVKIVQFKIQLAR